MILSFRLLLSLQLADDQEVYLHQIQFPLMNAASSGNVDSFQDMTVVKASKFLESIQHDGGNARTLLSPTFSDQSSFNFDCELQSSKSSSGDVQNNPPRIELIPRQNDI